MGSMMKSTENTATLTLGNTALKCLITFLLALLLMVYLC